MSISFSSSKACMCLVMAGSSWSSIESLGEGRSVGAGTGLRRRFSASVGGASSWAELGLLPDLRENIPRPLSFFKGEEAFFFFA